MRTTRTHGRALWRGIFALALALSALASLAGARPALAAPTELFFSEYIEGSSNNKALEIYNGTGAAINLATAGYNVQMFFNGGASAGLTINLTGTVANGDVFVVAQSSSNATILAEADQTNGSGWFNGDDAVVLRKGTTVLDVIGQVGFDPGSEWGSGLTSTADNTLRRKSSVEAGDTTTSNVFDPAVEWDGFATDTFDNLGRYGVVDAAPTVVSTFPVDGAADVALSSDLSVTFSEEVSVTGNWFDLTCTLSGDHPAAVSGGPTSYFLDPTTDFVEGESCTFTVYASNVADVDANDPPDTLEADVTVGFTPLDVCPLPYTPIPTIQGSGTSAATTGNLTTQGVVVGDFEGTAGLQGFYIQDPAGDGDASTSDGIFVFTGSGNTVSAGELVRVTGFARERFNQTTINASNSNDAAVPPTSVVSCGSGSVTPVDVSLPFSSATYPERYEGMLVNFPQALQITEYFNFDRFNEIVLGLPLDGEPRLFTPTALEEPGPDAIARAAANSLHRIMLDDGRSTQNSATPRHPNGEIFDLDNRFRGGDLVQNAVGVLGYDFNIYRIQPTGPADYSAVNPRPAAFEDVGGFLKVSAFNTLNYFLTLDYPGGPLDNKCGPANTLECRGADFDQPDELSRQRTKLLAAIQGIDADVLGLNELENSTGVEPLEDIVAGLNDALGAGTYAFIETGPIGTDAIKVGMIYKPGAVTPVGNFAILDSDVDPRFIDTKSRPVLAQTFEENATGARFTVAVAHLKSKGSDCNDVGDPDTGDGSGNCNQTRTSAAEAMVDWLASDPTGSGDPDYLIVGDLNSYAKEDPIDAILAGPDDTPGTADDYTNLILAYQGPFAYSYVFDGLFGYLDQALASATMAPQVTGAADWHINADEPDILDYDTSFKQPAQDALYEPNAYRTSDHDPVQVGLDLDVAPAVTASFSAAAVGCGVNNATLSVSFEDRNLGETHTATVDWGDGSPQQTVDPATSPFNLAHTYAAAGIYTATVTVTDSDGLSGEATASVAVNYTVVGGGVRPPISQGGGSVFNYGQTVPVKVKLRDCDGSFPADLAPTIEVAEVGSATADVTGVMGFADNQYSYDLATRSLSNPTGRYQITITVPATGQTITAQFRLR